ncbi:MAG: signal peptide peptidase SppA [Candidatus Cloacimonetes bacterium]|nr:signal peptide peptidase SppA [Candidatus Cloacimonadota bacterium]
MKRVIIYLLLNLLFAGLAAQEPVYCDLPVANTDGIFSSKINPAASSFGNAGGIGYLGNINSNKKLVEDTYSLFFNFNGFAYVLDHAERDDHTFLLSSKLFNNFYLGTSYNWFNRDYKKGDWQESILFRPYDFLSFGAVGSNIFKDERSYTLGVAARPFYLMGDFGERITLSTDVKNTNDEFLKPTVGLQTELLNGINIGGAYNLENETVSANFSVSLGGLKLGNITGFDKDIKFAGGNYYVHLSDKPFRSFIDRKKKDRFYDFKISGRIVEKKSSMDIGPFKIVTGKDQTISDIIKKIERIEKDDKVGGIIFKSGNFSASFANMIELQNVLLDFKKSGKKIVFYYENMGNVNYAFAASVADEIYLNPLGGIDLRGIAISMPYLRDALDKLGIDVINFRSHEFKTAGNMFSENEMTDAERESYEFLLNDLYDEIAKMIESGRKGKLSKTAKELIDEGPYFIANKALEAGLIDGLLYEDELEDKLAEFYPKTKIIKKLSPKTVRYDWSDEPKDKIAIIYAVGNIHSGKGQSGKSIGSKTTSEAIKKAREDKSVKGIILRIDSGGGSALASDIIAREMSLCREGENAKPVVVSMAGVAASGGYYIATYADEIIAQPTTITGSIGVVGIFPIFERMYDKLHINWSTVKKGKHSDIGATHRNMTKEERKMAEDSIEHFYDVFTGIVAKSRNMDIKEVHKHAQGRVWTGNQALKRGLIDKLGGMDVAVEEMKKLANIEREIDLVEYQSGKQKLTIAVGMDMFVNNFLRSKLPEPIDNLLELSEKIEQYKDEKVLMLMPFELKIED